MDPRAASRFDRLAQTCLAAAFLGLLSLPFLGLVLGRETPDPQELRALAPRPTFRQAHRHGSQFIRQLRAYLEDHFGFRSSLVRWNARLNARLLHVSPSPVVEMGRDGWLFYTGDHILEDCRHRTPMTGTELRQWSEVLEQRHRWLQQRGIRYLVFVAPNPHTIYPEFLPPSLRGLSGPSRLDQLMHQLGSHSTVPTLDLRPALLEAKTVERVYHKTDSHWNVRGGFVAYEESLKRLAEWFPSLRGVPRSRFEPTAGWGPGGDLTRIMGLTDLYREEVLDLRSLDPRAGRLSLWPQARASALASQPLFVHESSIPESRLPRLVMFHDSFASAMLPFLPEHFSRAVYVFKPMSFDTELLEREKPDLVIQEFTERYLLGDYGFFVHPAPGTP